jgi:ubiquinone biosynthesis protein
MTTISLSRLFSLCIVLMRYAFEVCASALKFSSSQLSGPLLIRALFEDLGGAFIKLGQMLALQPDILPIEYCNALFDLLDRIDPFPHEQAEEIFHKYTGKSLADSFDKFDPRPIATASIGQVYAAVYKGRKVAVKIQRPMVDKLFRGDIALAVALIRIIGFFRVRKLSWLLEPLSEFVDWTREELDYRREARYMDKMWVNAQTNPMERVPEVIWEYSTERTLVVEYLPGATVLNYLRWMAANDSAPLRQFEEMAFEPNKFACGIIDNFLGDAFGQGIFHADLHPANLIIMKDNVVGYIDFGITGVLDCKARRCLASLTLALTRADVDGMVQAFMQVSVKGDNSDPERFGAILKRVSAGWYEYSAQGQHLKKNLTVVMIEFLRVCREAGMWPERNVIKFIRSAVAIDGLITRFAPEFDLCPYLERICEQSIRTQMQQWLFSSEALLGLSRSSSRLIQDGLPRAAMKLRNLADDETAAQNQRRTQQRTHAATQRAFQFSLLVLLFSWAAVSSANRIPSQRLVFIVEAGIALVAAVLAIANLWRSARLTFCHYPGNAELRD